MLKDDANLPAFFWEPGEALAGSKTSARRSQLLALMIRADQEAATSLFSRTDFTNQHTVQEALHTAAYAASPHGEPLLKKMAFLTKRWVNSPPSDRVKDPMFHEWTYSLTQTGTPWCRDQLYEVKQWALLARMGDVRAGQMEATPGNFQPEREAMLNAFAAGDLKKAVNWAARIVNENKTSITSARPSGGGLVGLRSYPKGRLSSIMVEFVALFPSLPPQQKMACFQFLGSEPDYWPDALVSDMFNDPFAPVRLSVLLYLLEHPRDGFQEDLRKIEASDPYPWCRRVAHEILIFHPDPLNPGQGIRFELP